MIRLTPPVAPPVSLSDVVSSLLGSGPPGAFEAAVASAAGARRATLFGSGRAALTALLRAWKKTSTRDEVLVPAYTCWSVPASIVRAGLRVRLADLDPASFDIDPETLDSVPTRGLLAVVAPHLLAPSCDAARVRSVIGRRDAGVHLVEDAAQAWPEPDPARSHPLLLSFGRGKPLALGGGGAILHDGSITIPALSRGAGGWGSAAAFLAAVALARPAVYRLPEAIPFLHLGETRYVPDFDDGLAFRPWQDRLGSRLLAELPARIRERSLNAARLLSRIEEVPGWVIPAPARAEGPLRLPLLAPSRVERDGTVAALRRAGIVASPMYPGTLADIPGLARHLANPGATILGARLVAERLLTLPVYPGLTSEELDRIASAFVRAARASE